MCPRLAPPGPSLASLASARCGWRPVLAGRQRPGRAAAWHKPGGLHQAGPFWVADRRDWYAAFSQRCRVAAANRRLERPGPPGRGIHAPPSQTRRFCGPAWGPNFPMLGGSTRRSATLTVCGEESRRVTAAGNKAHGRRLPRWVPGCHRPPSRGNFIGCSGVSACPRCCPGVDGSLRFPTDAPEWGVPASEQTRRPIGRRSPQRAGDGTSSEVQKCDDHPSQRFG